MRVLSTVAAIFLSGALLLGCGDSDDPDAVTTDKLKGPKALVISDTGNGAVTLTWNGSNNEDDFDGYNVYGMAESVLIGTSAWGEVTAIPEDAIQLLDSEGEPNAAGRAKLQAFNYSMDNPFNTQGEAINDDGEAVFKVLPIHQGTGDDVALPTCKNDGGTCKNTAVGETTKNSANGPISYSVTGLAVGTKYCFMILSSMDEGEDVSQTSSNVACVTPKYTASFEWSASTYTYSDDYRGRHLKIRDFRDACAASADGKCVEMTASHIGTQESGSVSSSAANALYIENIGTSLYFVPGKFCGIKKVGYFPGGFTNFNQVTPKLTFASDSSSNPISTGTGYALPGQSFQIFKDTLYVFAVASDKDASIPGTQFYYHWVFVTTSEAAITTTKDFSLKFAFSKNYE